MNPKISKTVMSGLAACFLLSAHAASAHEDHGTAIPLPSIAPSASHSVTVGCPMGQYIVTGGVSSIDQLNATGPLVVTASYPSSTQAWTVVFTNRSGRPTAVNEASAVITTLCRYRH